MTEYFRSSESMEAIVSRMTALNGSKWSKDPYSSTSKDQYPSTSKDLYPSTSKDPCYRHLQISIRYGTHIHFISYISLV
ncbi:hypothetical protein B5X24_HaOG203235 [Helicoverpa armigera]|uniref:Uncharacterized protein n=1 Tax=Helicoverpa armigera TaxID=29058 RepID=A0A2W1BQY0_HELAM|nr:hypothetical protein B5X24_HaOG203235 [Helicoverpa armigera]